MVFVAAVSLANAGPCFVGAVDLLICGEGIFISEALPVL